MSAIIAADTKRMTLPQVGQVGVWPGSGGWLLHVRHDATSQTNKTDNDKNGTHELSVRFLTNRAFTMSPVVWW